MNTLDAQSVRNALDSAFGVESSDSEESEELQALRQIARMRGQLRRRGYRLRVRGDRFCIVDLRGNRIEAEDIGFEAVKQWVDELIHDVE